MRWGYLKFKCKHLYTENVVEILVLISEILQTMSAWKGGVYRNRTSCQRTTFWWAYLDSCFYKQRKVSCASKQNSLVNHLSGLCFTLSVIIFSRPKQCDWDGHLFKKLNLNWFIFVFCQNIQSIYIFQNNCNTKF